MGLKYFFKEIRQIRKHIFYIQKYSVTQTLQPLYHGCYNSNKGLLNERNSLFFQRSFTSTTDTANGSKEIENEDVDDPDKLNIRNILYKNSKDLLIQQLNDCASVQDVFNIIQNNHKTMDHTQISQAVLVLWDLQKIFYNHNIYYETDNSNNELNTNAILKRYMTQVNSHDNFDKLINSIINNYQQFSLDALTCTLLYLHRMGISITSNVMQLMILHCDEEIKNCDKDKFPLTALSRFIVTICHQELLYPTKISINALSIVLQRLETCNSEEDFKLLTICLIRMRHLITMENIETYKRISEQLINEKKITKQNTRTIIKALRLLMQLQWYEYNISCTNKFMYLLKGSINQLSSRELLTVFKIFQMQKEPANMLEEMQKYAVYLVTNLEYESVHSLDTMLDLLSCIVSFSSPLEKPKFEKLTRKYINNKLSSISLAALYKILYHIKTTNTQLCDEFWDKSFEIILNEKQDQIQNILSLCVKYIHFTQNISNNYRYIKFEQSLIDILVKELNTNIFAQDPEKFCRVASFIIAYNKDSSFDEKIIDQLLEMAQKFQFQSGDVLNISKGIQFALEHKYKFNSNFIKRIESLNSALNNCISNQIKTETKLPVINTYLRSFVVRKGNFEDEMFQKMLHHFVDQSHNLNSQIIKDLSFYLQVNSYLQSNVINEMIEYIISNDVNILGSTVEKVLQLCYFLGYSPNKLDVFLDTASKIIVRDKDRFSGLTFLQASLALCYFHKLPNILIKQIFSVDFLEKLDEELSNCYAKTTYPIRVRDHLMQLNRAVCLDYPESNIPWFHQKFVEESMKQTPKPTFFHKQVVATLEDTFKNTNNTFHINTYSPYGYHIDFEISDQNNATKTAVLLLNSKAFSNCTINVKGYYQLKQRHLEILGYSVINMNYYEWKKFYTHQDSMEYIKNKLLPDTNKATSLYDSVR